MRKAIVMILLLCMPISLVVGCAKKADTDSSAVSSSSVTPTSTEATGVSEGTSDLPSVPAPKSMTVWTNKFYHDEANKGFQKIVEQFGEKYGIEMNVEFTGYADLKQKWAAGLEAKKLPDISFMGYQEVSAFAEQGLLRDITDTVDSIEKKYGELFDNSIGAMTFKGRIYGLPYHNSGQAFIYRSDLLQAAGYTEPPKTWEEFRECAKALTNVKEGMYGGGLGYGMNNTDAEWLIRSIIFAYGGSIFNEDGDKVVLNSPETIQAVELMAGIYKDGSMPVSAANWDDMGNNTAYTAGQVAMAFNGPTLYLGATDDIKKVTQIGTLPEGPAGRVLCGSMNGYAIFKDAENPEWAEMLLDYIVSTGNYSEVVKAGAPILVPVFQKFTTDPVWQEGINKAIFDSFLNAVYLGHPGEVTPEAGKAYSSRYMNEMMLKILLENVPVK